MEELGEILKGYKDLGELTVKLLAYKYRIFYASLILVLNIIFTILMILFWLIMSVLPKITAISLNYEFLGIGIWGIAFSFAMIVVWILHRVFSRTVKSIQQYMSYKETIVDKLIFPLAFSVPFLLVYMIPSPRPYWETYCWFYAITSSFVIVAVFHERKMNKLYPRFSTNVYTTISIMQVAFSVILTLIVLHISHPTMLSMVSYLFVLISALTAAIRQIYSAEKLS